MTGPALSVVCFIALGIATTGQSQTILPLSSCSLTCGETGATNANPPDNIAGPTGKRGHVGPKGSSGRDGFQGQKGEPGSSCDCPNQEELEIQINKSLKDFFASEYERIERLEASGYKKSGNGYWYKLIRRGMTYAEAKEACVAENGGRLATVGMRNTEHRRAILTQTRAGDLLPWIGFDDLENRNSWKWLDGVATTPYNTDWYPGQPSGDGRCAHILPFRENWQINDRRCLTRSYALCEAKP